MPTETTTTPRRSRAEIAARDGSGRGSTPRPGAHVELVHGATADVGARAAVAASMLLAFEAQLRT